MSILNAQQLLLRVLLVLVPFLTSPPRIFSQPSTQENSSQRSFSAPFRIVAGASFDRNITPASIKTFGKGTITCGTFDQGGESVWSGSLGLRMPGAFLGMTFTPYLEYRDLSSVFTLEPPNDVHIANLTLTPERVDRERVYTGNVNALYVGATLDVIEWQGWGIGVSPAIGIPIRKSYSEEERITSNNANYSETQSSTIGVRGGGIETNPLLIDIGLSVSTSYRLKNGIILQPSIRATMPVIGVGKDASHTWKVYKMSAGLALGFDLGEEIVEQPPIKEPPARPDPVEPEVVKPAVVEIPSSVPEKPTSILSATISAVGLNDDGSTVEEPTLTVEKLQVTEAIPTLNYVFFGIGESDLNKRYAKLQIRSEVPHFDERELFAASAEKVHHQILNVIGSRMYRDKSATITLVGTRSINGETGTPDLGKQRAESIADYLTGRWRIDRSRIKIQSRQLPENPSDDQTLHGQEENRRVEIVPNKPSIVAPVWANRIERVATPPRILFEPDIISDTDVVSAKIVIRQNDQVLQSFDALTDGSVGEHLWKLSEESMPGGHDSIIFDLIVRDVLGNEVTTSGSIKLRQIRRETTGYRTDSLDADRKVEKYSLILFDYSSSSLAKHQADTIINYVARSVKQGSRLTITGHTDQTGNDAFNEQLAEQRAKRAAELLEKRLSTLRKAKPSMHVASHGSRDILFDNTKPEGRFLSRTVRVTVEEVLH